MCRKHLLTSITFSWGGFVECASVYKGTTLFYYPFADYEDSLLGSEPGTPARPPLPSPPHA